VTLCIIINKYS